MPLKKKCQVLSTVYQFFCIKFKQDQFMSVSRSTSPMSKNSKSSNPQHRLICVKGSLWSLKSRANCLISNGFFTFSPVFPFPKSYVTCTSPKGTSCSTRMRKTTLRWQEMIVSMLVWHLDRMIRHLTTKQINVAKVNNWLRNKSSPIFWFHCIS